MAHQKQFFIWSNETTKLLSPNKALLSSNTETLEKSVSALHTKYVLTYAASQSLKFSDSTSSFLARILTSKVEQATEILNCGVDP